MSGFTQCPSPGAAGESTGTQTMVGEEVQVGRGTGPVKPPVFNVGWELNEIMYVKNM